MVEIMDITYNIKFQDQKSKSESLGLINSFVSHELKNPLSSVQSQVLRQKGLIETINRCC